MSYVRCGMCGQQTAVEFTTEVDGQTYCRGCIHDGASPMPIYPIGIVHAEPDAELKQIELQPFMARFMEGLEEENHLTIVFWLHKSERVRSVFHRGWDGKEVGVFAARTPHRLTPLAITEVELVRIDGTTLHVRGLDAFDGSPVMDIKLGMRALRR